MRNVLLTEKQFYDYIDLLIENSFIFEKSAEKSQGVIDFQKKLGARIADILSNNTELQDKAELMGINPSYSSENRANVRNVDYKGINLNAKVRDEIKNAARILAKYTHPKGKFMFNELTADYPNEYKKLLHIKEFLDAKGLSYLYDTKAIADKDLTASGRHIFGANRDDSTIEQRIDSFDLSTVGQVKDWNKQDGVIISDEEAIVKMKGNFLDAYMDKVYGLKAELPKTVFSNGNKKLPSDTLIINFTAAMQCPAWNECLLKNACYARKGEKQHTNVRDANVNRNLMWEAGHQDPELMEMIFQLLRLYCVNYNKVVSVVRKQTGKKYTVEELSKQRFSELSDDVLNIVKANTKIKHIRLNENGDFIGDWLIRAIDDIAGDFMIVGILTSAYTCRNIRSVGGGSIYDNVANIILNVSNEGIKSEKVTRYFYAIDPDIYNAFDETYGGPNNSLVVKNGKIDINPQPLYKYDDYGNIIETGTLYYKCPCERKDKSGKKINCYNCNVCYEPNTISDKPYFVLVQIHSNGSKKAQGIHTKNSIPSFGFSRNFNLGNPRLVAESKIGLYESIKNAVGNGVLAIARNCVRSIKEHLNGLVHG